MEGLDAPELRVFVVWEPVIITDLAPPSTTVLSKMSDSRAAQFYDEKRALSDFLLSSDTLGWGPPPDSENGEAEAIVWDHVLIFPPGAQWEEMPPPPDFEGGPVVGVIDQVRETLESYSRRIP